MVREGCKDVAEFQVLRRKGSDEIKCAASYVILEFRENKYGYEQD